MSFKNPTGERGDVCSRRQRRGCKQLLPLRAESPFCTTFEGCQQGVTTLFWGPSSPSAPSCFSQDPPKIPWLPQGCPPVRLPHLRSRQG